MMDETINGTMIIFKAFKKRLPTNLNVAANDIPKIDDSGLSGKPTKTAKTRAMSICQ
jgi:hypothetical protein